MRSLRAVLVLALRMPWTLTYRRHRQQQQQGRGLQAQQQGVKQQHQGIKNQVLQTQVATRRAARTA
jgi:hypothetical protein